MRLSDYDYELPVERIAQEPLKERDKSKLLVLHRDTGDIEHRQFFNLPEYLRPGDLLVLNDTQVTAVRLTGVKPSGGKVEALLLKNIEGNIWEAMVKPGRRVDVGATIIFGEQNLKATVLERTDSGGRIIDFGDDPDITEKIQKVGEIPLPPYIQAVLKESDRYQTVYASEPGSAAAPTAGFHFTPKLLDDIRAMGILTTFVTLHVGIATFRPVRTDDITEHVMHKEHISVSKESADIINSAKGRVIAVGTTTARVLESAATARKHIEPVDCETDLFITPGYEFKIIDGLITNFHIPKSTLLILVSSFAGRENIMRAYSEAREHNYRFLSFGDAMLLI
ncbi:MAG: tRNA preQ1(34) S-adenosylmethionine ribosyltransferase-isomerase QueA [Armatimonadota bacterium]